MQGSTKNIPDGRKKEESQGASEVSEVASERWSWHRDVDTKGKRAICRTVNRAPFQAISASRWNASGLFGFYREI